MKELLHLLRVFEFNSCGWELIVIWRGDLLKVVSQILRRELVIEKTGGYFTPIT
jgi:hypothetical protein